MTTEQVKAAYSEGRVAVMIGGGKGTRFRVFESREEAVAVVQDCRAEVLDDGVWEDLTDEVRAALSLFVGVGFSVRG